MWPYYRRDRDTEILRKRSTDRDLAQVVPQDLGAEIMTERSWTRDPHKRSCTSGPIQDPDAEILTERSCTRDLAQVVIQDPAAEVLAQRYAQETRIQRSCTSGPAGSC